MYREVAVFSTGRIRWVGGVVANGRMFAHGLATLGLMVLGVADVAASLCALPAVLSVGVWDAGRPTLILALRGIVWLVPGMLGMWLLAAACFGGALAIACRMPSSP